MRIADPPLTIRPRPLIRAMCLIVPSLVLCLSCRRLDPVAVARLEGVNRVAALSLPPVPFDLIPEQTAIDRAIASSVVVAELVSEVDIASKQRLASRDLRDPELRLAYGENDGETARTTTTTDSQLLGDTRTLGTTGLPIGSRSGQESGTISGEGNQYQVGLRFFVPNPFVRKAVDSSDTANIYARVADLYHEQWQLAMNVRRLFTEVRHLEDDILSLSKLTGIYSDVLERERSRLDRGAGSLGSVMTASRQLLGALSQRESVIREQELALQNLSALVAIPASQLRITPKSELFNPDTILEWKASDLVKLAQQHREDLVACGWATRRAEATLRAAKSNYVPWPTYIQTSYGEDSSDVTRSFSGSEFDPTRLQTRTSQSTTTDDGDGEEWRIDAAFTVPIFAPFNNAADVTEAEYHRAVRVEDRKAQSVEREVRNALDAVKSLQEAKRRFQEQTQSLIEEIRKTVESGGVRVLEEVDVARLKEELIDARRTRLRVEHDYALALIALEEAVGTRLERIADALN